MSTVLEKNEAQVGLEPNGVAGMLYGICAYTSWGILPLYWKLLATVPALQILAHRILWSFVFSGLALAFSGGYPSLRKALADKRQLKLLFLSGFLISVNWYTYIWTVNSGRVIEASMGYYINPLIVVVLSVVVLKEKLQKPQIVAISLAAIGVALLTFQYGKVPWAALFLAGSFALYGLAKKLIKINSLTALVLETLVVTPIALLYILSNETRGVGALSATSGATLFLLVGAGIVTGLPLLLFAQAAQRIKLSMVGFLQYIAPTISLILGVFVFKESFTVAHFLSFAFIWVGLVIFTVSNVQANARSKRKEH